MKYFAYSIILFTLLLSCNKRTETNSLCYTSINPEDAFLLSEIKIPLEGIEQYNYRISQTWINNEEDLFIGLNEINNCLDIYSLTERKLHKTLCAPTDGSRGSINITDFFIHSKDTILLFSSDGQFQLIDINGILIDQYKLHTPRVEKWASERLTTGFDSFVSQIFYDGSNKVLYIPSVPPVSVNSDHYYDMPNLVSFDLKSRDYKDIGILLPPDFQKNKMIHTRKNYWYRIIGAQNNELLISYMGSEFLIKGDLSNQNKSEYYCRKVNKLELIPSTSGDLEDINIQKKQVSEAGIYASPFYHPLYKKYVSTARKHQNYLNADGMVNNVFNAEFSILIMDSLFSIEKEIMIPVNKYNYDKIFPHSKGILVLKENPNNDDNEEDLFEFSVFDIN